MPFRKVGRNTYKSPSGRTSTAKQVRAYYATNGFTRAPHAARKARPSKRRR